MYRSSSPNTGSNSGRGWIQKKQADPFITPTINAFRHKILAVPFLLFNFEQIFRAAQILTNKFCCKFNACFGWCQACFNYQNASVLGRWSTVASLRWLLFWARCAMIIRLIPETRLLILSRLIFLKPISSVILAFFSWYAILSISTSRDFSQCWVVFT